MTEAQYHAIQIKAMRNGRASYRSMDSQGEVVERQLDRMIRLKTVIRAKTYDKLAADWAEFKKRMNAAEKALADAIASGQW
jgi:hypothetical protein